MNTKFTDLFIKRPVLASVVSLVILVLGLRSIGLLPVLQFPYTQNAVVTVTTAYPGADANLVASFITTPLENAIAQANGIDFMTSSSVQGVSTITVNLRLNYDPDKALTEINAKANSVLNQLPPQSQKPILSVSIGQTIDAMYIGFNSKVLKPNQITDYINRSVQPRLQAVEGVQTAEILGAKNFALRAWLDPQRLAAHGLTAADIYSALAANNFLASTGNAKGQMVQINLAADTDLKSLDGFKNLVVKSAAGQVVRLNDVATVALGSDDYDTAVAFDGKASVFVGIQVAPGANLLDVVARVREVLPDIQSQLPVGLQGGVIYDSTKFVNASINEVVKTLAEAVLIVTLVVFVFLGSLRSVIIPLVAIPLSIVGAFTVMLALGYSINLLTLLAIVLAIGLVVDDAIIVVENVSRHLEQGMARSDAAILAARELANPIVAMTIVLVAVYVPIGFMGGLTGALFTEFAFTLVGTVVISAIIALTLSPMMCSRLLKAPNPQSRNWQDRLALFLDRSFDRLHGAYERILHGSLNYLPVTMVMAAIVLGSIYYLYATSMSELAPQEDQGVLISIAFNNPTATLDQRQLYANQIFDVYQGFPETDHVFQLNSPAQVIGGMVLKPWNERQKTAAQLQPELQKKLSQIAGSQIAIFQPPPLPGARGVPIQFVITSAEPFDRLYEVSQKFLQDAQKTGQFIFLQSDLRIDMPQTRIEINRDMAAQLGLTMQDIGSALSAMLGGGYVNFFELDGRSYKVIPQVEQRFRLNPDQINHYYLRTPSGQMAPLSTVVSLKTRVQPETINHFQQANSATIQGVALPFVAQGQALDSLKQLAQRTLPAGYGFDFAGPSRQFIQESGGLVLTFFFALVIIFLALAAQFESFRDPVIILVSVPMAISGALLFINLGIGRATLNIYTEVGLVTLIGLISKHGILIVEFANNLQRAGQSKLDAIKHAAGLRLRPILMTTAAMVFGVMPLIMASGAGAVSRFNLGLVIAAGLTIGTLFTLFVVPAMYMILGADHGQRGQESGAPIH
ncbi:MAG: multidrug efflux protein [Hydrogenophilales bacterium CG03_land_8_20_14_0_80_62_28]|nr:MMPL family transporter [Betaproteobacteria bacterium]OIO79286.1 MAG: multidrug efflux protein [Hydrogenophilaceae bacterium CG1_02_62_390]PIV23268.1 MAG: multidrug efflux protein [Hydrogenophilales bacterium CG03_land_8_20_14_0_80_62_28]PIW39004.1 MAG: multidrug efflux protein [Hydrogenophilales bacterium CG15_BIG_FIL_POST_REV_8_21_14_020_62_31]PIW70792.1 MAG: multidrug efflux protein [Hydrogenophilales bacterium CG12_big_fil_rev_8_21_14_0_65_61_21]PIX02494.1 MAG: multidrug efflux protein 